MHPHAQNMRYQLLKEDGTVEPVQITRIIELSDGLTNLVEMSCTNSCIRISAAFTLCAMLSEDGVLSCRGNR